MSDVPEPIQALLSGELATTHPKPDLGLDDPSLADLMVQVIDASDALAHRARVVFKNGFQLSIIDFFAERQISELLREHPVLGGPSQSTPVNQFEIALITPEGEMDGAALGFGTVLKRVSAAEVRRYIRLASQLPAPGAS